MGETRECCCVAVLCRQSWSVGLGHWHRYSDYPTPGLVRIEWSMRENLVRLTTSPGWRLDLTPSGTGSRPGTTAGSSAWTPSPLLPCLRLNGLEMSSVTRSFTIYGLEVGSVTSKDARGGIYSQQSSMVGTGLLQGRGYLHLGNVDTVSGPSLEVSGNPSLTIERLCREARMKDVLEYSTTSTEME